MHYALDGLIMAGGKKSEAGLGEFVYKIRYRHLNNRKLFQSSWQIESSPSLASILVSKLRANFTYKRRPQRRPSNITSC